MANLKKIQFIPFWNNMLRGYAINQKLLHLEERIDQKFYSLEQRVEKTEEKIDFFVRTNQRDAHNATTGVEPIDTFVWSNPSHDRWLIIDDQLYHCGHSLKDMGKKLSAISLMGILHKRL